MIVDHETDEDVIKKFGSKFLGTIWSPREDLILFSYHVNISLKTKKGRADADIDETTLHLIDKKDLTLRIVTSVVSSWYDNSGLVCPYTMKFKLLLQKTVPRSDDGTQACQRIFNLSGRLTWPRLCVLGHSISLEVANLWMLLDLLS